METLKSICRGFKAIFPALAFALIISIIVAGCQSDDITEPTSMTEDEYLKTLAINTAYSSDTDDDDNLFSSEVEDFDSQGAVGDFGNGPDTPIDSLLRWGRRVTGVNVNAEITYSSDTLRTVEVTRTISGNFIIVGYVQGVVDSVAKPYVQEQRRIVNFKRVNRRPSPRLNWRVFEYSAVDGKTLTPQNGKDNIVMNKVEIYRNNQLVLTLNGPDFTVNMFRARFFNGAGLLDAMRGDQVRVRVYLTSNQTDTDYVAYHWARNSFGFHRERFTMISQVPNGNNFDRIFEKEFTIYGQHHHGIHNGYISANTRESLYDNDPLLFSSTYMGMPYRVRH